MSIKNCTPHAVTIIRNGITTVYEPDRSIPMPRALEGQTSAPMTLTETGDGQAATPTLASR